jgi:hypothetical protein
MSSERPEIEAYVSEPDESGVCTIFQRWQPGRDEWWGLGLQDVPLSWATVTRLYGRMWRLDVGDPADESK